MLGRGKEKVGEDRQPYAPPNNNRSRSYQGSKPTVGGFRPESFPLCNKCGQRHMGTICPDAGNGCFHCKELGHIKKFCPKLNRGVNAAKAERPRTTCKVFTMSGAEMSDVDGSIRERLELQIESLPFDLGVSTPTNVPVVVSKFVPQCPVVVNVSFLEISLERERARLGESGLPGVGSPERELSRLGEKWHSKAVEAISLSLKRPLLRLGEVPILLKLKTLSPSLRRDPLVQERMVKHAPQHLKFSN
ncbi:hypothetical protein Lal_00027232 [Lupinus albus]|nr:hypothetical protein Lal_00027232 [Lupinus albus]